MRKSLSRLIRALQRKLLVRVCIGSGTVVRPGDTLILRTDVHLTDEELAIVRANFADKFPGVGFVRLSASSDIVFIRHPVADSKGNDNADSCGRDSASQPATDGPQSPDPSPEDIKEPNAHNDGLPERVLNGLCSQADRASSNFEHTKLPAGHWLRDAIVTDIRENGPIIQPIRKGA